MLNLEKIDFEIMDALSDGLYPENLLYGKKYDYELAFNRPWHDASGEEVKERVALMLSAGYLARFALPHSSSAIGLTKQGGGGLGKAGSV